MPPAVPTSPSSPRPAGGSWRSAPLHLAQGLLMGTADVVPGISGGTMALIVGIYERLVGSLREGLSAPFWLVAGRPARTLAALRAVEWTLVVPLAVGVFAAIVVAAGIIPPLIERFPAPSRGLFFGLIVASVAVPWRALSRRGPREVALIGVAAVAGFLLTGLPALAPATDPSYLRVFASAAVAICAMILPGVSGSFLLLVLGMYTVTLDALNARDLAYVAVFVLGCAVGLGLFSRVLTWLLAHRHDTTMAVLVGLMIGSLRALWPWQTEVEGGARVLLPPGEHVGAVLLLLLTGVAVVAAMLVVAERLAARRATDPPAPGEGDAPDDRDSPTLRTDPRSADVGRA